jgi:hypothetical protein
MKNKFCIISIFTASIFLSCTTTSESNQEVTIDSIGIEEVKVNISDLEKTLTTFKVSNDLVINTIKSDGLIDSVSYIFNGKLLLSQSDDDGDGVLEVTNFHFGNGMTDYVSFHSNNGNFVPFSEKEMYSSHKLIHDRIDALNLEYKGENNSLSEKE